MCFDRWVCLLIIVVLVQRNYCVVMPTESSSNPVDTGGHKSDIEKQFGDSFFQCYKDNRDSAIPCIDESAKVGLSAFFSKENLELSEGLSLVEEENPQNLDDPIFRDHGRKSFVDAASAYLAARSIRWDMSVLYPGLVMRVGPTLTAGSGVLEFVMEPTKHYTDRGVGPGRLIMRQTIVPLLLGVKVSIAALVPLLLFGVVILVKKALVLSQVSAVLSTILGFGSVAAAAAAAGGGYGGGIYSGGHGHAHIADGLPVRHRLHHHITQLPSGPLIVDVPPPWSTTNIYRTEESSSNGDKVPGETGTNPSDHHPTITRTSRKTKNPQGFLWESEDSRKTGYNRDRDRDRDSTSSNIFPREN